MSDTIWRGMNLEEIIEYSKKYDGLTRTEIARLDMPFYKMVKKNGLKDQLLPPPKIRMWHNKTNEELKKIYHEEFSGYTRTEVSNASSSFYKHLCDRELIDELIPLAKRKTKADEWENRSNEELKEFVLENYGMLNRGKLHKKSRWLYSLLKERGILDDVVLYHREKEYWPGWTDDELRLYLKENYDGKSRRYVRKNDHEYYTAIKLRKLLPELFPKST